MNVFFTTPYAGKSKHQVSVDAIVNAIKPGNRLVTPENPSQYINSLTEFRRQGLNKDQAHYAFIRQGIASADVVIIEASQEDIRVGHELTLALLFHKPTLVLSKHSDFSQFITHDLLQGAIYGSDEEAVRLVKEFLKTVRSGRAASTMQTIDMSADSLHAIALAKLRQLAKQETGQFGEWSRKAEEKPLQVSKEIHKKLGKIKKQPAWSVFAPIYNEDSPDYIQTGVARFVMEILGSHSISRDADIVEAACGTAALSRQLASRGLKNIVGFDVSRPMLAEAFRLSSEYPQIKLIEADINTLALPKKTKAIVWTDYSSNFALEDSQLKNFIVKLTDNLEENGILIFDIRTYTGWQIDFYSQPITTFATERFQRIWLNQPDQKSGLIHFDVFIRVRDVDGNWSEWRRESMTEKMWTLRDVIRVVRKLPKLTLEDVYGDDFRKINPKSEEPNLAYLVIRKTI